MPAQSSIEVALTARGHERRRGTAGAQPVERTRAVAAMPPYRGETYYDIPPIRHSHYKWKTCTAFFCNSVAGGSQMLATIMDLLEGGQDRHLVRTGRYLALAGGALGTAVLISALHTPQRWYNMLRMFKSTSPMSIGIWSITPFVALSGLTVIGQVAEDRGHERAGRRMGRIFCIPAALLGGVVATYMGTELEETNMPLWASAYPLLAPLYAAVGFSTAGATLGIAAEATNTSKKMKSSLNRLALASGSVELLLLGTIDGRWRKLPEAMFFDRSFYAPWFRIGFAGAGVMAPLLLRTLQAAGDGWASKRSISASIATLAGSLIFQFVMVYAGRESGLHARDYFEYTRPMKPIRNNGSGALPPSTERAPAQPSEKGERGMHRRRASQRSLSSGIGLGLLVLGATAFVLSLGRKGGVGK